MTSEFDRRVRETVRKIGDDAGPAPDFESLQAGLRASVLTRSRAARGVVVGGILAALAAAAVFAWPDAGPGSLETSGDPDAGELAGENLSSAEDLVSLAVRRGFDAELLDDPVVSEAAPPAPTIGGRERQICLADRLVRVFEFGSVGERATVSESISTSGQLPNLSAAWIAAPRFFAADQLIALHLGEDSDTTRALDELMGATISPEAMPGRGSPGFIDKCFDATTSPPTTTSMSPLDFGLDNPPSIFVEGSVGPVELTPHSWCWTRQIQGTEERESGCADGFPQEPYPFAGDFAEPLRFSFPIPGWEFTASMTAADNSSGGPAPVTQLSDGLYEIGIVGQPGPASVFLSGSGEGGSISIVFSIELQTAGPEPLPAVDFAGFYGVPVGTTGLALSIVYLAADNNPSALVRVTAANGATGMVALGDHQDGPDPEGNGVVSLHASQVEAQQLIDLGPAPYDFEIELEIDGTTHTARFSYPEDLDPETSSFHPDFSPPLPARVGAE